MTPRTGDNPGGGRVFFPSDEAIDTDHPGVNVAHSDADGATEDGHTSTQPASTQQASSSTGRGKSLSKLNVKPPAHHRGQPSSLRVQTQALPSPGAASSQDHPPLSATSTAGSIGSGYTPRRILARQHTGKSTDAGGSDVAEAPDADTPLPTYDINRARSYASTQHRSGESATSASQHGASGDASPTIESSTRTSSFFPQSPATSPTAPPEANGTEYKTLADVRGLAGASSPSAATAHSGSSQPSFHQRRPSGLNLTLISGSSESHAQPHMAALGSSVSRQGPAEYPNPPLPSALRPGADLDLSADHEGLPSLGRQALRNLARLDSTSASLRVPMDSSDRVDPLTPMDRVSERDVAASSRRRR